MCTRRVRGEDGVYHCFEVTVCAVGVRDFEGGVRGTFPLTDSARADRTPLETVGGRTETRVVLPCNYLYTSPTR